jgi:hypothetical protein
LKDNCLNYSAEERQRQTALAQRDCVMAKKQWRSVTQQDHFAGESHGAETQGRR